MSQPTVEIDAFIERVKALPSGPGVSLDDALQPCLEEEAELRKLFASDRQNERIANPHVGLVDVFAAPQDIKTARVRVVKDKEDLLAKYVMPIDEQKRKTEGSPCMVADLEEFKKNWSVFSEGSLSQLLDWNNVVAAGGSVLACLGPLDDIHKKSKRAIRKYYHNQAYPTSDVDLFLYGMNAEQAEAKIKQIYEAVRDSVPWDVTCIRTKHTVSIHSQYPYRSVQIVLRLYHSPAEILAGFDIDAPCCAYDGNRVWASPRAVVAMMRQCNTVDVTRRSPSYEVRLAKYSRRGFEVYVPALEREKVDPTIYERSIFRMEGLARLLVLEKLHSENLRDSFLKERRELRGRPRPPYRGYYHNRRTYKGDLKEEEDFGLETNNYNVATLHIPYGPGWDAKRIDKLVYQTDLGMNSTFNPKNKGRRLHRHPAFFGTVEEVVEDCCEHCPEPVDQDERDLQKEDDEHYIRGRIKFIEENPGRQSMSGSFNPIDDGEWTAQVYMKPTEALFKAIAARDSAAVKRHLKDQENPIDIHQRDHVGRTFLHVAILSKAEDIAMDIVDADARITARLADGRGPMHLAARFDMPRLIKKLVERSKKNEETEKKDKMDENEDKPAPERPSSEDDWSSHDDEDVVMSAPENDADDEDDSDKSDDKSTGDEEEKATPEPDEIPSDETEEPDIIDINIHDWDFGFTALCYAIIYGSQETIDAMLEVGADPKLPTQPKNGKSYTSTPVHPLTMALMRADDDAACKAIQALLKSGATSSSADPQMRTIFYTFVVSGRNRLIEAILKNDPDIHTVINFPAVTYQNVDFPITAALQKQAYSTVLLLAAYGAKLNLDEADITRAVDTAPVSTRNSLFGYQEVKNYLQFAYCPLETALLNNDEFAFLLVQLGTSVDVGLKRSYRPHVGPTERRSIKDWVDYAVKEIADRIKKKEEEDTVIVNKADAIPEPKPAPKVPRTGWLGHWEKHHEHVNKAYMVLDKMSKPMPKLSEEERIARSDLNAKWYLERLRDVQSFFLEVQALLSEKNAKTWSQIHPDLESRPLPPPVPPMKTIFPSTPKASESVEPKKPVRDYRYVYLSSRYYGARNVAEHQLDAYDELFEACYTGDNQRIQALCLPIPGQTPAPGAPSPLNIGVRMVHDSAGSYHYDGYTPLYAAIAARKWATAKIILAIATAQYHPEEEEEEKVEFDVDINMDDDSDADSDASGESDVTVEQNQVTFIDISKRPSEVRSEMHPRQFLQVSAPWRSHVTKDSPVPPASRNLDPITTAVFAHDLELFVQIANLHNTLSTPVALPNILETILSEDQADILDEYIKRTGQGIDEANAKSKVGSIADIPLATNDENKSYLGLNFHGKKRKDLASRNDPHANYDSDIRQAPILWRAVKQGSKSVVTYLSSGKPLAAFQHYASTQLDRKALWFKRIGIEKGGELEKHLPTWLGWTVNHLGDSPVAAAIIGGRLDMIELLSKLDAKLVDQALQTNIQTLGLNPLLMAVRSTSDTKLMDYLLSHKVSPSERDSIKGWNIYHFMCESNQVKLLKYFLEKLPRDVNELLLSQQSRLRKNTPLHVAVKTGKKDLVSTLLNYSTQNILIQDIDGQTALHCAAKRCLPLITKTLLASFPSGAADLEDAVGNTAYEIASLQELVERASKLEKQLQVTRNSSSQLTPNSFNNSTVRLPENSFKSYQDIIKDIQVVVETMLDSCPLSPANKDRYKTITLRWIERTSETLAGLKARETVRAAKMKEWEDEAKKRQPPTIVLETEFFPIEGRDVEETFKALNATYDPSLHADHSASTLGNNQRKLIHLLDVQKSVASTLGKVNPQAVDSEYKDTNVATITPYYSRRSRYRRDDDDEELGEEDDETGDKAYSYVFQSLKTSVDSL